MRSTGEVMGHAPRFHQAFAKAQLAAGVSLPTQGGVLVTVNDLDKSAAIKQARDLHRMDFRLYGTPGTAVALAKTGLPVTAVAKAGEPGITTVSLIASGEVQLIINTPLGQRAHADQAAMYAAAIRHGVPLITTMSAAQAAVGGIKALRKGELSVRSLQAHHGNAPAGAIPNVGSPERLAQRANRS
jgi:carbamoyl-phosphate synthase large subunit